MEFVVSGIDYATGLPVVDTLDEALLAENILDSMRCNIDQIRQYNEDASVARRLREEVQRIPVDWSNPHCVGWTFLVNAADPQHDDILRAIRPLALHRRMVNPKEPLYFRGEPEDAWHDWLRYNYASQSLERVPHYVLIIGGPEQVPFRFQAILDIAASVGRVSFDAIDDLECYVEKLIRLERADELVVERQALFFAPENQPKAGFLRDATYYSRRYMAEPLADYVREQQQFDVNCITGREATKNRLDSALRSAGTALVYTASHGLNAASSDFETQKRLNGAIHCGNSLETPLNHRLYKADDLPQDGPFLEGAVFFQFACFGYGTPAVSEFSHWRSGLTKSLTQADFVAAIPKKLLAHPRGPIAYIGHVDQAWLHGFADPNEPHIEERWHRRISPFVYALNELLGTEPCGRAMMKFNEQYALSNAFLTNTYDRLRQGQLTLSPSVSSQIADQFIGRTDAQNHMVFGDPAARLRIPSPKNQNAP